MKRHFVRTFVVAIFFAISAQAWTKCPPPQSSSGNPSGWTDPRGEAVVGNLRLCGEPMAGEDTEQAAVVVMQGGTAPWAEAKPMPRPGRVRIQALSGGVWRDAGAIAPPEPRAYGWFGAQVVANQRWALILDGAPGLESAPGRVWVYRTANLELPPIELALPERAQAIAIDGDTALVRSRDTIHLYGFAGQRWTSAGSFAVPQDPFFEGQIAIHGDLLVSTSGGPNQGDGWVPPGRVDVLRRGPGGWRWEARLFPNGRPRNAAFGSSCCVAFDAEAVLVTSEGATRRFERTADGWRQTGGPPVAARAQ